MPAPSSPGKSSRLMAASPRSDRRSMQDYESNRGTRPVAEAHRFDIAALERYMQANVAGFRGPVRAEQFRGGQSNPTFKLSTPDRTYVLRRKPPGKLLPSAHAVDREYRVITALSDTDVP